jgi:hypothetical protein
MAHMLSALRHSVPFLAALSLASCVGSNFVRPDDSTFKLGTTTYAEVIARMGSPTKTSEFIVPTTGKRVKEVRYGYATFEAVRMRIQLYYFYNDVLVGREFTSNFPEDSSDWNERKVDNLVRGKTTRAEVIRMLGRPSGARIWPATANTSGEAITYYHVYYTRKHTWGGRKQLRHTKDLVITFDTNDQILVFNYAKQDDN